MVDRLVDHWATLRDQPAGRRTGRLELERLLREPPPEDGRDPEEVLRRVETDVLAHMGRVHHPRFFAFVPGPGTGVVTGAAETWFSHTGPSLTMLSLLICVSEENPWLPRLPATFGKSLSAGAQHDDRSAAPANAGDDAAIAMAAAMDDAMRLDFMACLLL